MTDAMKKQWDDLKAKHPDALLLFRCGDFYETYGEDAKECAKVLGITLTWRDGDREQAMAGFPHHALDTYLPKLVRTGHRVAICDQLEDPKLTKKLVKRGITELVSQGHEVNNNIQNSTTMTQNMKATDLIGKTIKVNDSKNYYVVKSADGDKLTAEFHMGERVMPCPIPMSQLNAMVTAGKWTIGGDAAEPIADDPNGEPDPEAVGEIVDVPKSEDAKVTDPTPAPPLDGRGAATAQEPTQEPVSEKPVSEKPTAKTIDMKPTTEKPATEKPVATGKPQGTPRPSKGRGRGGVKPEAANKLKYETYTNKNGKTCARIVGFAEGDAMLERSNAERIHASSTYERDKNGAKVYMLIFGPRYAAAAKDVCRAMNQGKTLDDCQAIIDQATEERVQKREEWKAKRAAYLAGKDDNGAQATGAQAEVKQGYSDADVAAMLRKIMAGGAIPEDIKKAMAA